MFTALDDADKALRTTTDDLVGPIDNAWAKSWNSAHPSRGCDPESLVSTGGAGLHYCFAAK